MKIVFSCEYFIVFLVLYAISFFFLSFFFIFLALSTAKTLLILVKKSVLGAGSSGTTFFYQALIGYSRRDRNL